MKRIQVDARSYGLGVATGLAAGLCAGSGILYLVRRRAFEARLNAEVDSVKAFYNAKVKALAICHPEISDSGSPVRTADLADRGSDNTDDGPSAVGDDAGINPSGFVIDESVLTPSRDTSRPYPVSAAEFAESPVGFQQLTITWYAEDEVLVDEKEQPIPDVTGTTGLLDLESFGGISEDPNIRYVRNERLEVDFEIVLDRRSYVGTVLNYGRP